MLVTEEKLNKLIKEAFAEVILEAGGIERLARKGGEFYQWLLNKKNNVKGSWEAGRRKERMRNLDYDPYGVYGDDADKIRNLDAARYSAARYNKAVERNANAQQYPYQKNKKGVPKENGTPEKTTPMAVEPNPDLVAMSNNQQQQTYKPGSTVELNPNIE